MQLESALIYGPLNRGADELVQLSVSGGPRPREIHRVKLIVYNNIKPDLENRLSFTQNPTSGTALNPEAKPFVLGQFNGATSINKDHVNEDKDEPVSDHFEGLVPSQVNFAEAAPTNSTQRFLTKLETAAGTQILFFYRRHSVRQRVRARRATRVIWAYYTRHRRRHQNTSERDGDALRKLHQEYKRDIEGIECPLLLVKRYRYHKIILQGLMPHVLVYLRGLERANQLKKDATKKRLQRVQHEELDQVQATMTTCK
jgi:hypothetical protein